MGDRYKASRYNIALFRGGQVVAVNSATRAALEMSRDTFKTISEIFPRGRRGLPRNYRVEEPRGIDPDLRKALVASGFLVDDNVDELEELKAHFQGSRHNVSLYYTVGMTMSCNFGCPYCFEEHKPQHMDRGVSTDVARFIEAKVRGAQAASLQVSWFGGEPLLNLRELLWLSSRLRDSCGLMSCHYESGVITNGALLSGDVAKALAESGVDRAQVTIDGPADVHDSRRFYKGGRGSYARIVANLEAAKEHLQIVIRMNVDSSNRSRVSELLGDLAGKGLFAGRKPVRFYASPVVKYTEQTEMLWEGLDSSSFVSVPLEAEAALQSIGASGARMKSSSSILETSRGGCNAMHYNSFVIGPRGHLYKCELGVHDERESLGTVSELLAARQGSGFSLPVLSSRGSRALEWDQYIPFENEKCAGCQYVPICKGGCPKKVLEGSVDFMEATCRYWDENFGRLVNDALLGGRA